MSFNLFGPATKCDIRVGYIDPDLGYVKEVSIHDANRYAFKNPGTTFIFETRDNIRYLNINEVNNLTANDLLPKDNDAEGTCDGVSGLSPLDSPIELSDGTIVPAETRGSRGSKQCRAYIKISGGGGTGAVANPVFGSDGSLLAVDVVRGGFGYQYPPVVKLIDECKRGSGAVLRSVLGERPPTTEYFDQEDDFEFYDFSRCTEELEGYGTRFGVNGEVIGGWDPTLYATLAKDPIRVEIKEYQDYLAQGISPFWSTRKEKPLSVTFRDKINRIVHPVSDLNYKEKLRKEGKPVPSGWGPWMNTYAVSPVPPQWNSDVPGSDYAGGVATMVWEEEFPYTGIYKFKAMADNIATIYVDNTPILQAKNFIGGPTKRVNKLMSAGVHEIKIDLHNIPQLKKVIAAPPTPAPSAPSSEELLISYRGMSSGAGIRRSSGTLVQIDDDIDGGFDENARFEIISSTCGARFSEDGRKILYSGSGEITIKMKYRDKQSISGLAITDIEVGGTVWERKSTQLFNASGKSRSQGRGKYSKIYKEKGEVTKTISVKGASKPNAPTPQNPPKANPATSTIKQGFSGEVFNTVSAMGAANRRLWRTNVYGRGGFLGEYGVCPFDTKQNLADNPYPGTHLITWPKVEIPQDGNYDIEIEVDDSVKLTLANEVIQKNGFVGDSDKGTGKSTYTRFFRKGTYPLTAELYQKPGGRFSFQTGASVATKSGGVSARFTRDGGDVFLVVEGSGSAKIDFSLRTSDTPSGGLALTEVSVGNANLKRTRSANIRSYHPDGRYQGKRGQELTGYSYKRKETITGSGTFTAGQRYKVVRKGAAAGAPSPRLDGGKKVFFNDSGNDSFDAELKINRVHSPQPAALKGVNPMALAVRISGKPDEYVVSPVTWKENPMGVALTIDSPLPPIPEEPIPPQEGRCPNNPFWTTRFTGGKEKWWPVNVGPRWSDFMNRYAISPIAPRSERTTDGGGIPYFNTWNLDIPYNGYFGIKGTCDNFGSILIDGQEVYKLAGFKNSSPPIEKVYLSQGQHQITVKVENQKTVRYKKIEKAVFDTKDWGKPLASAPEEEVQFHTTSSAAYGNAVEIVGKFKVAKSYKGAQINDTRNVKFEAGRAYDVVFTSDRGKNVRLRQKGDNVMEMEDKTDNDFTDVIIRSNKGRFYDIKNNGTKRATCKFVVGSSAQNPTTPKEIGGVKYSGPDITKYTNPNWSSFMNMRGIALYKPPRDKENPINGVFNYTWSGVNLDATGQYAIRLQADVNANQTTQPTKLYINDTLVASANSFRGDPLPTYVNLGAGKVTLRIEETVIRNEENVFNVNPFGFGLQLTKVIDVPIDSKSWIQNPVGVSAILIPPPCPKTVEGKGIVTDIIADEPGNGYPQPPGEGYPVVLRLKEIVPTAKGINYAPNDQILVNGIPVQPQLGPFGTVESVPAVDLFGFTDYPNITLPSDTGVGFRGRPVFEPVIVPEDVFEEVIQVTDLVGLKQTGYVNGKPYYGSVYSENGQLFAGIYATIGDPIPVYATLQESIDAEVVTRPSAILRQGTDVTNADPRLNIPGTPDDLV